MIIGLYDFMRLESNDIEFFVLNIFIDTQIETVYFLLFYSNNEFMFF